MTHGFFCAFDLESAVRHSALVAELVKRYRAEIALRYLPVRYEEPVLPILRPAIERLGYSVG